MRKANSFPEKAEPIVFALQLLFAVLVLHSAAAIRTVCHSIAGLQRLFMGSVVIVIVFGQLLYFLQLSTKC